MSGETARQEERGDADPAWEEALDWLFRLDERPDDEALRAALDAWLDRDPAHGRAFQEARGIWEVAPALTPTTSASWSKGRKSAKPRLLVALTGGALAACLALFLLLDGWARLAADHTTGTGEISQMTLADGSRVTLDSASALSLDFQPAERRVALLRGRAFFEVAEDSARPFRVQGGALQAEVVGTRFELRQGERGSGTALVAVTSGRVRVTGPDGLSRLLEPGQSLRLDRHGQPRMASLAPDNIALWRRQRLRVEHWSVARTLEEIDRYFPGLILLRGETLSRKEVSGSYDLSRPRQAVEAVARAYGARVKEFGPWLLVVEVDASSGQESDR